ncbi:hypothetical protein Tco_0758161 [Tanacetum coccineum]
MYYPRFTKVIINHFMSKNQSIPRRNKVDWHMAKDDPTLTTMTFIPKHETVQKYDAILPDTLTNQALKESDTCKNYHDFATGKVIPKPKYVRRSTREKTNQAPKASPSKRLKATAKVAKSGKKKLLAQGLKTLSEIALSEADQMKLITKRSKTQFHSSYASGLGKSSDEDDDDEVSMSKDNDDNADNEDDDDQDEDNEQTESDNDGDDFVHPKFSTHDEETSHAVAANLSELELKKILIDKIENNKSIDRSVRQKNLYKTLVDAYESDKDILATYRDTETLKRRRDDEEPSVGSNRGSKRRRDGKEPESSSAPKEKTSKSTGKSKEGSKSYQKSTGKSAQAEEPIHTVEDLEEPAHQEFNTGYTKDQPVDETTQLPDWFQKPTKPPTPDRDWNKTLPAVHGPIQPWISTLA